MGTIIIGTIVVAFVAAIIIGKMGASSKTESGEKVIRPPAIKTKTKDVVAAQSQSKARKQPRSLPKPQAKPLKNTSSKSPAIASANLQPNTRPKRQPNAQLKSCAQLKVKTTTKARQKSKSKTRPINQAKSKPYAETSLDNACRDAKRAGILLARVTGATGIGSFKDVIRTENAREAAISAAIKAKHAREVAVASAHGPKSREIIDARIAVAIKDTGVTTADIIRLASNDRNGRI